MLGKILSSSYLGSLNVLKIRFNMSISWKKIKEKMFEREDYYKDYEMTSTSLRIDHEKYKIYITPHSPEVARTNESTYRILENQNSFNLTFLQNLDYMGKQFTWSNRKNISISFRDILKMQTVSKEHPVTIQTVYYYTYNNEELRTQKQLKIQVIENGESSIKLSLSIQNEKDGDKWIGVYELNWNDYIFLVQSAKKNIYYGSGLKTMIELQKRQIVRLMEKRVVKDQEKLLKSTIEYDLDKEDLLSQMEDGQNESDRKESSKTKKKAK